MNLVLRYLPLAVLGLFACINVVRGGIHLFAPDGGAGSIAGLDLSRDAQTILALFAIIGINQLILGLFQVWIVLLRRNLLLVGLVLQAAFTLAGVLNLYLYRTFPVEIPGRMFNTVLLVFILAAVAVAFYNSRNAAETA